MKCILRFDRWLSTLNDPTEVLDDPALVPQQAAAFRRWTADPDNRLDTARYQQHKVAVVHPQLVNDDLRAVAELFAFVAANHNEARRILGRSPWHQVTETHAASWFRQVSRIPSRKEFNEKHYVDDHALAQIPAALPLIGLPRDQQMQITRGTALK